MSFSQLSFVFLFLPVCLLGYFLTPKQAKPFALLIFSLLFIAWGNPRDLVFIGGSVVFHYFSGLQVEHADRAGKKGLKKAVVITTVAADLLLLGFFKYYTFLWAQLAAVLPLPAAVSVPVAPVGVSFFTFSVLSYLLDVSAGRVKAQRSLWKLALYVCFFPKLVSGPIAAYEQMEAQLAAPALSRANVESGSRRFVVGLAKKVLLANTLNGFFAALTDPAAQPSVLGVWLAVFSYAFMLYFDFSGYSDMAIGLGRVFGYHLPENFRYPYLSGSVTDFWRRWHISLGAWFKNYVYIPLGGSRAGTARTVCNLAVVWLLTGLWHGANWTFVVWGLYHLALLLCEKFILRKPLAKTPGFVRGVFTFVLVILGWVFFFNPTLPAAGRMLAGAFGYHMPAVSNGSLYTLLSAGAWLAVAAVGCTPLPAKLGRAVTRRGGVWSGLATAAVFALLLAACIAGMMNDTFASFLYAQF